MATVSGNVVAVSPIFSIQRLRIWLPTVSCATTSMTRPENEIVRVAVIPFGAGLEERLVGDCPADHFIRRDVHVWLEVERVELFGIVRFK